MPPQINIMFLLNYRIISILPTAAWKMWTKIGRPGMEGDG